MHNGVYKIVCDYLAGHAVVKTELTSGEVPANLGQFPGRFRIMF